MDSKNAAEVSTEIKFDFLSIQNLLLNNDSKIQSHVDALEQKPDLYVDHLQNMVDRNVFLAFSSTQKARVLAACMINKQTKTVNQLLDHPSFLGLAEILRAVQYLDSGRKKRSLQKKLDTLEAKKAKNPKSVKTGTIAQAKTALNNASQEFPNKGSVSGAVQKRIRRWVTTLPAEKLEFFLTHFPTEPWKQLADICHLNPSDFKLPYFLKVVFGEEPPADSVVAIMKTVTKENFEQVLRKYPHLSNDYSYFRKKFNTSREAKVAIDDDVSEVTSMGFTEKQALLGLQHVGRIGGGRRLYGRGGDGHVQAAVDWILEQGAALDGRQIDADVRWGGQRDFTEASMILLATHAPLEDLIWFSEELDCKAVEDKVCERLAGGERIKDTARTNYGKLMERLLLFREKKIPYADLLLPYAEGRLTAIHQIMPPSPSTAVAVFGDASGSMSVAIKCACALGSLFSAVLQSDLVFFNEKAFDPPKVPRTAQDAIKVVESVKAGGGTAMAAPLHRYYASKRKVDLIILVSDEEENEPFEGFWFLQLFQKYKQEVNPVAKCCLVSFLPVGVKGNLKTQFDDAGVEARQLRLDKQRPDTSKFDALLGMITLETSYFEHMSKTQKKAQVPQKAPVAAGAAAPKAKQKGKASAPAQESKKSKSKR